LGITDSSNSYLDIFASGANQFRDTFTIFLDGNNIVTHTMPVFINNSGVSKMLRIYTKGKGVFADFPYTPFGGEQLATSFPIYVARISEHTQNTMPVIAVVGLGESSGQLEVVAVSRLPDSGNLLMAIPGTEANIEKTLPIYTTGF
jgi:hypothetical protein